MPNPARNDVLETTIIFANIQGLIPQSKTQKSKLQYLGDLAYTYHPKILAFTESHLSSDVSDAEIHLQNYTPYRSDRKNRSHGGVVVYVLNSLVCDNIFTFSDYYCSLSIVKIPELNMVLIAVYRPPDSPTDSFHEIVNHIGTTVRSLSNPVPDIIIVGDFNFPRILWPLGQIGKGGTTSEQNQSKLLLNLMGDLFLSQYILKPTRENNILDLVLTNNDKLIHNYDVVPTIFSDHNLINISLNYEAALPIPCHQNIRTAPVFSQLNFLSADWDMINACLMEVEWGALLDECNHTAMVDAFVEKIEQICLDLVPPKRKKSKKFNNIPRDRKIMMKKRTKLTKQLKLCSSPYRQRKIFNDIHHIERDLHHSYTSSRQNEESKAVSSIKANPKYFYAYAKRHSSTKTDIGPFIDDNGCAVPSNFKMAEMLRLQYERAFTEPFPEKSVPCPSTFFNNLNIEKGKPWLDDLNFTPTDISRAIDQLNPNSAPGPDAIPTVLLKNCKNALSIPLHTIWQDSLNKGEIHQIFRTALVTPIHKGGSRAHPQNFRPISLTSHIIKVFERVLREKIVDYLESNNLMNPSQHGFRSGRSCLSQLLDHFDRILACLEQGLNVDVIYLDFAKAFDKVDHGILYHKLRKLGVGGSIGCWLHAFLSSRSQVVTVNNSVSCPSHVRSGVPQGTVLGPILFLVHISDINEGIYSHVASFADDTRITRSVGDVTDVVQLQRDLDQIYDWQLRNNMAFNESKFEMLRYGKDSTIKLETLYTSSNGTPIMAKPTVRDLGILMSDSATFGDHIDHTVEKAKKLIAWILRTFSSRDSTTLKTLWGSLVQPHLDYCSQLWTPSRVGDLQKLESLQRSFTSLIDGMKGSNYWQRLKSLNMYSQGRRHERYLLIYTWKILEEKVPNIGLKYSICPRKGRLCKIPALNRKSPCYVKSLREASFAVRGPRTFNSLPQHLRNLTGCGPLSFKRQLDRFLSNVPDEPRIEGYTGFCRRESNMIVHMVGIEAGIHAGRT